MDDSERRAQYYWQSVDASTNTSADDSRQKRIPLGMDSFDEQARHQFGQQVQLAMALMEGSASMPADNRPESAMPRQAPAIARRLKALGQDIASNMADQLELLVRFNELEGWRASGARHCAAWMNVELGIGPSLSWEYLRVGRLLRNLPITTALFRAGRLNWSKVRLISRVASVENEGGLCHAALDASVTDVQRFCSEYRWDQEGGDCDAGAEESTKLRTLATCSNTTRDRLHGVPSPTAIHRFACRYHLKWRRRS